MRLLAFLLLLASATGLASPLFEDDAVLELTLEGPLATLMADTENRDEYAFALKVEGAAIDVDVRVRGISRVRECDFPPLRLDFSPGGVADTIFAGQNKLKLVTHCKGAADFEQNVLEEYAAYRIFNLLSAASFRVRLLRIRYVDTDRPGDDELQRYGFLIESKQALAARNGGTLADVPHVDKNLLDEHQAGLAYIFHYLIGNTDWSLVRADGAGRCCHNGLLVTIGDRLFYVPYDFDLSGLVNARYARPDPGLRIRSVRQRKYRGYCTSGDALRRSLQTVVAHRDEILGVIEALPQLSTKDRQSRASYLQRFFESAANEDKLLRRFESRCL